MKSLGWSSNGGVVTQTPAPAPKAPAIGATIITGGADGHMTETGPDGIAHAVYMGTPAQTVAPVPAIFTPPALLPMPASFAPPTVPIFTPPVIPPMPNIVVPPLSLFASAPVFPSGDDQRIALLIQAASAFAAAETDLLAKLHTAVPDPLHAVTS